MSLKLQSKWQQDVRRGAPITSLAVSESGVINCCTESSSSLLQIDSKNGELLHSLELQGGGIVHKMWMDPSRRALYCCGANGTVTCVKTELKKGASLQSILKLPIDKFLQTSSNCNPSESPAFTNSVKGRREKTGCSKDSIAVHSCIASPKFNWIATTFDDSTLGDVAVWRVLPPDSVPTFTQNTALLAATLHGHSASVLSLAITPDGSILFTGSYDHTVRAWDTTTWNCIKVLKGHGGGVRAMAVSADGHNLYTAGADNTVRAWNIGTWVCMRLMHGRHEETTWPAVIALNTPNTTFLVTGSTGPFGSSTLKTFHPSTGDCLATFSQLEPGKRGGITAIAFSPGGNILYSGASDGSLAAWALDSLIAPEKDNKGVKSGFFN